MAKEERYCRKGHLADVHEFEVYSFKQMRINGKEAIYTYTRHICKGCKYKEDAERRRRKTKALRALSTQ
jgi:hypothetical protein